MPLSLKIALAIVLTVIIHKTAQGPRPHLSAMVPLFPTFVIIAAVSVLPNPSASTEKFVVTGLLSLIAYAGFLATIYLARNLPATYAILTGIGSWSLVAYLVVRIAR